MRELETCLSMIGEAAGRHSGVLARTGGTTVIAHFGLPPGVLPPAVSALQATHAGMEILDGVRSLNEARIERGMGPLQVSVAVATGDVVAGTIQIGKGESALLGEAMIAVEGMLASRPRDRAGRAPDQRRDLPESRIGAAPVRVWQIWPNAGSRAAG